MESDIDENAELLSYVVGHIAKGLPVKMDMSESKGPSFNANCTSFQAAKSDGTGWWYGRNYDFFKNPTLVVTSQTDGCGLLGPPRRSSGDLTGR